MTPDDDLDARISAADPDRWLAARLAPEPARRAELIALYALNDELARLASQVSNPMLGDIRLAWWREGLEAAAGGGPVRAHPVLAALAPALREGRLRLALLERLIEARARDLEPEPFADEADLVAYLDGVAGSMMAAAALLLAPDAEPHAIAGAARAWGWTGIWRAGPALAARNRQWKPKAWPETSDAEVAAHVRHRVGDALASARAELASLPVAAFPAVAYATLARPYAAGRDPGGLEKRLRLLFASLTGRV